MVLFGRLALACALAATVLPSRAGEAPAFDVLTNDVTLRPDFSSGSISGEEVVRFRSLADGLDTVSFSANSLTVLASIDGEQMVASEIAGERWLFHLPRAMRKGQVAKLVVSFSGKAPKGLVFGKDQVYATYFTCVYMICDQDRPGDKARVNFRLVVPEGMTTVAPGTMRLRERNGKGTDVVVWREKRAMSAYLLGFAAGRFQTVLQSRGLPELSVLTTAAGPERAAAMFADTGRMVEFFEDKAGVKLPGARYTQVLVEGSEAQEAAGHSVIGMEEISPILEDPHEDWVIAHELAHQWWGNSVTCADWSELWLNEGLTVFMVAAYKETRWGRANYDREMTLANKRWGAAKEKGFDVPLSWRGVYPSLKLKRAMAYAKSVVFLDLLRTELGEAAFWRAIKDYTRTNWGGTVRARDLQRAMERAAGRDLSALFAAWVFGPA
jgi:aminopeptidase N